LLLFRKHSECWLCILVAGLWLLLGCGQSAQPEASSSSFSGSPVSQTDGVSNSAKQTVSVARVGLNPAVVIGGNPSSARIVLTHAAPSGGARVLLSSSNRAVVLAPASVTVPAGQTIAVVELTTFPVPATTLVAITASYNNSVAGSNLKVNPPKSSSPSFTVIASPSSVSIQQGASGASNAVTTANGSFNHAILLTASGQPSGVSVSLNPVIIAPPGSGTSQVDINVDSNVTAGNYPITISGTDGTTTHSATLQLTVSGGSSGGGIVGPLTGCTYNSSGHRYQAVKFEMNQGGTVPFDAKLYFGATCDPNKKADEFGFGNPLTLGGFGYIFWFHDFPDQPNTSAIWMVGNQTSQCVDYSVAPDC
jgi:hypothetical protein